MKNYTFYAVRNKDGKYFKSKGYGGYGKSWRDNLNEAKIYSKPGPARAQVTFWATNYPDYGVPDLIEFVVNSENIKVMDEGDRIDKVKARKEREKKRQIERNMKWRSHHWWGRKSLHEQVLLLKGWIADTDQDKLDIHKHPDDITVSEIIELFKYYNPSENKYK